MLNKVLLIGNLGDHPRFYRSPRSGTPVTTFNIATNRRIRGKRHTEWFRIVTFNDLALVCQKHLIKGRLIFVEGSLQTHTYTDSDSGERRKKIEVIAKEVQFLDRIPKGLELDDNDDDDFDYSEELLDFDDDEAEEIE